MPEFAWRGLDPAGQERSGSLLAGSAEEARARLERRRLYVVRLEPAAPGNSGPSLASGLFVRTRLGQRALTLFTRQLATLALVSPLEEAVRTLAAQADRPQVRHVLGSVQQGVVEGLSLSEAMAREPASFPLLYRAMVAAGEASGTLPAILDRLATLQERQAQVRGRVFSTLAYPAVLTLVALFVVVAMMVFVVPKVVEQFESVGQQLPLLTRLVIDLSEFVASFWWALAAALLASMLALAWAMRREATRLRVDRMLLRLPLVGRLIRDLHAARMARTLSTMVGSRLPLLDGLRLTAGTLHNRVLRQASLDMAEAVRTGGSLSGALRRTGLFPPLLVYLAASGEQSGRLELMLEKAADYLEREFDTFTTTMLSLLEPAIIVVMGVIVGLIVLSILLPILQLDALAGAYP